MDRSEWIAACAHQLQRRWRTVDPETLEDVAGDLWGDVTMRTLPPIRAAAEWLEPVATNGVLARLGADDIARGAQALPDPGAGQPERMQIVLEVGALGLVRVTYSLSSSRHRGRGSHFFWTACHAEVAPT
jgi:hypothetical protein